MLLLQEIASKLIASSTPKDDEGRPINPLDANFRSLHLTSMDPVAPGSKEFTALEMYTRDTHGATHQHYQVQVQNAFRVERYVPTLRQEWHTRVTRPSAQAGRNRCLDKGWP